VSLTTLVESRGGNSGLAMGAADRGDTGKKSWGRGPPVRLAMPGSRVKGGGAPTTKEGNETADFGSLTVYFAKSIGF
jgi:hypothetical protein